MKVKFLNKTRKFQICKKCACQNNYGCHRNIIFKNNDKTLFLDKLPV